MSLTLGPLQLLALEQAIKFPSEEVATTAPMAGLTGSGHGDLLDNEDDIERRRRLR